MAHPAQDVLDDTTSTSHVVLTVGGTSIGKVLSMDGIDVETKLLKYMAANAGGTIQVAEVIETEEPTGEFELTIENVPDLDGTTLFGKKATLVMQQLYVNSGTVGWKFTAANAYIQPVTFGPARQGSPTETKIRVIPYAAPGTPAWAFDPGATL